jgi:hypothetical protein
MDKTDELAGDAAWMSYRQAAGPKTRLCGWPDCAEPGAHRAPVSREHLNEFYWFCLDHVRIYNRSWNYYVGMSDAQVEACVRSDTIWNRPSWPFAGGNEPKPGFSFDDVDDPLGVLRTDGIGAGGSAHPPQLSVAERQAFTVLGLEFPVSRDEVKARYKELVKRHHPDANGGDKDAEERSKRINQAHEVLMSGMFSK